MSTWIGHLRIAEKLLAQLPGLDEVMFTYGNLAPDSGMPNEDWTEFDPPKTISHFILDGAGEGSARDLLFYRQYLAANQPGDSTRFSFMLGYFTHLVCDHLAAERIGQLTRVNFPELFQ